MRLSRAPQLVWLSMILADANNLALTLGARAGMSWGRSPFSASDGVLRSGILLSAGDRAAEWLPPLVPGLFRIAAALPGLVLTQAAGTRVRHQKAPSRRAGRATWGR